MGVQKLEPIAVKHFGTSHHLSFVVILYYLQSHLECPLSKFPCIQVLRFGPPMCITEEDVKFSISVIRKALDEYVDK